MATRVLHRTKFGFPSYLRPSVGLNADVFDLPINKSSGQQMDRLYPVLGVFGYLFWVVLICVTGVLPLQTTVRSDTTKRIH